MIFYISKICPKCGEMKTRQEYGKDDWICRQCQVNRNREYRLKDIKKYLLSTAKRRARIKGYEFTITTNDFEVPERCPILNLPLAFNLGGQANTSPTLDRIINEIYYVPGNVQVISWRANKLKGDGTIEELEAILSNMKRHRFDRRLWERILPNMHKVKV